MHGRGPIGHRPGRAGSSLWLGDVKRLLLTNLLAYGGRCWMVTVTAPGSDVLPWDHETGKVESESAELWNRTAQRRWSELHRWAGQATAREFGSSWHSLARVWQLQSRGVLHLHLVLAFETPEEQAASWFYVRKLRQRRAEFGFGYIDARDRDGKAGKSTVMEPHRAGGYLSRYLGESSQLVEALALRDRPRRLVQVSRRLLAITGCTMRRLRRVRFLWWLRRGESRVFALAGSLPRWFGDPIELGLVQSLARAP